MKSSLRRDFLVDNLDLPAASGVGDARWEYFQLALWSDDGMFRIEDKSRQIAWSFAAAADAIASMVLEERDSVFVSINQEESQEKIRYANDVYDNLRVVGLPRKVRASLSEVEFDNGVRITSFPSRPVRGRPRANLYFDEFAHAQKDREIYAGSLPVMSKGGRLRIGSSPLGASGVFWEVFTESLQKYPSYTRKSTPWWEIYAFCTNVKEARKLAPAMETFDRVEMFGNDRIKALFANMVLEDFQQEYECLFVDETTAWITWDEIKSAEDVNLHYGGATARGSLQPEVKQAIFDLVDDIRNGLVEQALCIGVDIGRTRNTTEIKAVGLSTTGQFPVRLMITLDNIPFDDQQDVLMQIMHSLPVVIMLIDQNGIGMQLAENLANAYPIRVQPAVFNNASKALWATDAKMLIQKHRTPLPVDREFAYQIHSIKKLVTGSNNLVFDTEKNEKHHADQFWAWALALHGAYQRPFVQTEPVVVHEEIVEISPY